MKNLIFILLILVSFSLKAQQTAFDGALQFDTSNNLTVSEKLIATDSIRTPLIYSKNLTLKSVDNNQTFSLLNDNSSTRFTSSNKIDFFTNSFELSSIASTLSKFSTYSATTNNTNNFTFFKSHNDNYGTFTRTVSSELLGKLNFNGVNSSNIETNAMNIEVKQFSSNADYIKSFMNINATTATTSAPFLRFMLWSDGQLNLGGMNGECGNVQTYSIALGKTANQSIGVDRNTGLAGKNLLIEAGGAGPTTTDKNSGILQLKSGLSTGTGFGQVEVYRNSRAISTGTADNVQTTAMIIPSAKPCTDNTATNLFSVVNAVGTSSGISIKYTIKTTGGAGNESHTEVGQAYILCSNDGSANSTLSKTTSLPLLTDAGSYTVTFATSNANPCVVSVTADSTLNVASIISYTIINKDEITITQL